MVSRLEMSLVTDNLNVLEKNMEAQGINLNITGRDEHVPKIERFTRTIKLRTRAIVNTLTFDILPNRLVIEVIYNAMFWLNCFPHKDGVHATMSPHTIVTESNIDYNKHCKLQIEAYVQVHKQQLGHMYKSMNNTTIPCSCICQGP